MEQLRHLWWVGDDHDVCRANLVVADAYLPHASSSWPPTHHDMLRSEPESCVSYVPSGFLLLLFDRRRCVAFTRICVDESTTTDFKLLPIPSSIY